MRKYVNVYEVTRHYGGPEEGGWWYDAGELVDTIQCRDDNADLFVDLMEKRHREKAWGDISSVLGGANISIYVESKPGRNWPQERPYYC